MRVTNFYKLLLKAKYDEATLIIIIEKIMPMIDKYSQDKSKKIDDELKSILIEYAVNVIKDEKFADKLAKD